MPAAAGSPQTAPCGDIGGGGCADDVAQCADDAPAAADPGEVVPVGEIESVQVRELDDEHEMCAVALNSLAADRDPDSLRMVLVAYQTHFAHEEQLLDQHLYPELTQNTSSGGVGGFNAQAGQRKSHYADHARLIRDIETQLTQLGSSPGATVPAVFVDKVLRDFELHAHSYDGNYAEPLAKKLRAAADSDAGDQQGQTNSEPEH